MKKIFVLTYILFATLTLAVPVTSAAFNPHIPDNQGTKILNDKDGCRPDEQAGSVWVQVPGHTWLGARCCAAYALDPVGEVNGDPVYAPNQCCNPPDFAPPFGVPGNHCLCFALREYAEPE